MAFRINQNSAIFGLGLFEFLSDDEIVSLLDNLYEDLESGGKLYSTTLNFQTPLKTVLFFHKKEYS